MIPLIIILAYLAFLPLLGAFGALAMRRTSADFFLASRSIGSFLFVLSIFGTAMSSFALVGSTGESYLTGIGVFGMMASWSSIVHAAVIFLVGIPLWAIGRRYGYTTQIQFFCDRFECPVLGLLLFPTLVALLIPYLLIGILGAGATVEKITVGAMPNLFPGTKGGIPHQYAQGLICLVVLIYVFHGGLRSTAWVNAFQTLVFIVCGMVIFFLIAHKLGGLRAASQAVAESPGASLLMREGRITKSQFLTYALVPFSIGMFPHIFQHWLTARNAAGFRATVVWHPIFIAIVWAPCVMLGVWASAAMLDGQMVIPPGIKDSNAVLGMMVQKLTNPALAGFLGIGILAATSLDSQFLSLGAMFTHDVVMRFEAGRRLSEPARVRLGRGFIVAIAVLAYLFSLAEPRAVFRLGVWCFSAFTALFPIVVGALYWKRTTAAGVAACVLVTALSWLYLFWKSGFGVTGDHFLVWGMMPVAPMTAASTLALILVSWMTRPPSSSTLDKFFSRE